MNFISLIYFIFLICCFILYWNISGRARNIFIVAISCIFYAYWNYRYLAIIAISIIVSYYCGNFIFSEQKQNKRKLWLWISLFVNIGLLGYFKYTDFFIDNLNNVRGLTGLQWVEPLNIILPIGISFYIFQSITYPLAIYGKRLSLKSSLIDFAAYVTFFPKLIAGPIERAEEFLKQINTPKIFSGNDFQEGCIRILTGFFKKAVIADTLAEQLVAPVFSNPGNYSTSTLWIAMFGYAIQIYADFSGYSNIAIGSARLFGFKLNENFLFPYLSTSFSDFWRRWHITMSTFFRDYIYIPLGGNRSKQARVYSNLLMTMLLCGLWHGAAWTFIIWGGLHGLFLTINHITRKINLGSILKNKSLSLFLSWIITQIFVCVSWVFFRSESFDSSIDFITGLLVNNGDKQISISWYCYSCIGFFVFDHIYGWVIENSPKQVQKVPEVFKALIYTAIIILSFYLIPEQKSQFIYFNF